jgi:hypothetical protein
MFLNDLARILCGEKPKKDSDLEAQQSAPLMQTQSRGKKAIAKVSMLFTQERDPEARYGSTSEEPQKVSCIIS